MKVSVILGTRPEIIKTSPIIHCCERLNIDYFVVNTGQHYSPEMGEILIRNLGLPHIEYTLKKCSGGQGQQTGEMLAGIEEVLLNELPDIVLVQGDTNTALAGALAASKLNIKVGHVEAGLRSFDRTTPEEINRIIIDHISDYLFAPTELSRQYLLKEGIPEECIFLTGNTIVDALQQNLETMRYKGSMLGNLGLKEKKYFLATIHRAENVDHHSRLKDVLEGFRMVVEEFAIPIVLPLHPRTAKMIEIFGYAVPERVIIVPPLGYHEFLQLARDSRLILSDSGGLQEEACILGVGCVTLREHTERPETVDVGANMLAGTDPLDILNSVKAMMQANEEWEHPYGDGRTAEKIVEVIKDACDQSALLKE